MRLCILFLCVLLVRVIAVRNIPKLNSINDLKNVNYGRPYPHHGLQLLFWFSQRAHVDQTGIIIDFNPLLGDFGFHYFGNRDPRILPGIENNRRYSIVGNLDYTRADEFPAYVRTYSYSRSQERNMDRLIVSVNRYNPYRIHNVYITTHGTVWGSFNPAATYEIGPALIQELGADRRQVCIETENYCCYYIYNRNSENTEDEECDTFLEEMQYWQWWYRRTKRSVDDANKVTPTRIKGFDASLQLYTEDGYACARLYIKKTFSNWKDTNNFYYSWVGFYTGIQMSNKDYNTYQYAINFDKVEGDATEVYDIYTYKSSLAIASGVQIRFLLDKEYNRELAQTTPWEGTEEVRSPLFIGCDDPIDEILYLYGPKLFYGAEFDDANRVIPTKIRAFDGSLQLFTKDGYTCARLYIRKTFRNWKNDEDYSQSWVGFYSSSQKSNKKYDTFKYVVDFDKVEGDNTENYDVYTYQSSLKIANGVQIRFLCNNSYDCELARTTPWQVV